jgi:hypothetical protein
MYIAICLSEVFDVVIYRGSEPGPEGRSGGESRFITGATLLIDGGTGAGVLSQS